jgi:hypothetical protein
VSTVTEVGAHLETDAVATVGTDLFLGRLPDSPDDCLAVIITPGLAGVDTFTGDGILVEQPGLQILARGANYSTAETLARSAFDSLVAITNEAVDGTQWLRCAPVQSEPFSIGRDDRDRAILSCNFEVMKEPS